MTPVTSAGGGGQAWVPAGRFARLLHRKKLMPPFTLVLAEMHVSLGDVALEPVVAAASR